MGCCNVDIDKGQTVKRNAYYLIIIVVKGNGPSLMGRNWLKQVTLDWHEIRCMLSQSLQAVLDGHPSLCISRGFSLRQDGIKASRRSSMSMQQPRLGIPGRDRYHTLYKRK